MTVLDGRVSAAPPGDDSIARPPRSADATTIVAIFVVLQFVLPSKLVLNVLPLSLSAASLVALGMGALWLCTQMTTTLGAAKGRSPVRSALFAYLCAILASYANASYLYLPSDERQNGDHAMVIVFAMVFVGLVVCDGVRSRDRIYFLLRVIVVCGSAVAVVGILQFLFGFDLTPHLRPPGMHFTATDPVVLDRSGLRRVSGTTAHPIEFGVLCAMLLPVAIHVAVASRGHERRPAFWWGCVGLLGIGLMFSVSRSAILAAGSAAFVLFLGWSGRRRVQMAVIGAGFLVFVQLVSPGLLSVFLQLFSNAGNDDSIRWRTHDYATAQELISQHPLLGRGVGTWYAPKHEVFDNQYLLTLVESGLIGLLAFLSIFASACYAAVRVMWLCRRLPEPLAIATNDRDLALSLTASLVVLLPTYATFDLGSFATVTSTFFVLAGISGALLRTVHADVTGESIDAHAIV